MPGPRKFNLKEDIFKNEHFLRMGIPAQKYSLAQWNAARSRKGLPRVFPPLPLVPRWSSSILGNPVNVTHRPVDGNTDFIPYSKAFPKSGPLIDLFNKQNSTTTTTTTPRSTTEDSDQYEIRKLNELFEDYDIDEFFRNVDDPETVLMLPSTSSGPSKSNQGAGVKNPGVKRQKTSHSTEIPPSKPTSTTPPTPTTDMVNTRANPKRSGPARDEDGMEHSGVQEAPISESPGQSGHNAASDGGFDSAQGPESYLSHCDYKYSSGHRYYEKTHRFKGWAFPITWGAADEGSTDRPIMTPMNYIPVDKIYMYMSRREFDLIPPGSHVVECKASLHLLNSSTSFNTATSDTNLVTAQHVRTGLLGVDLDKKLRGGGVAQLTIDNTMIPSFSVAGANFVDFVKFQYGSWAFNTDPDNLWDNSELPGCAYGIPYINNAYFCMKQMNEAGYTEANWNDASSMGHEYFSSCITEFNMNDKLWDKVCDYHYKFESAPIGNPFRAAEIDTRNILQHTGTDRHYNLQRSVVSNEPNDNKEYRNVFTDTNRNGIKLVTYSDFCIEKGGCNRIGSATTKPARQPTLWFGMRAIGKAAADINVRRSTEWVNADVEFYVKCSIVVKLPESPNRFTQPGRLNVSIENAVTGTSTAMDGTGAYGDLNSLITYNLKTA